MTLNGYGDELNGYNQILKIGSLNKVNPVKAVVPPIGSIMAWHKTFGSADSGTTDGTTADKLVESGQNFEATVIVGMIVHNTTDDTFSYVTAVDSNTTLSLNDDIMITGENYVIYKTPYLPDGYAECNGQALSDSDSPYNGETIPDLNGDNRFLRGNSDSGTAGGAATHTLTEAELAAHTHSYNTTLGSKVAATGSGNNADTNSAQVSGSTGDGDAHNNEPQYVEMVWIMRVK